MHFDPLDKVILTPDRRRADSSSSVGNPQEEAA
jgi:hypothetical protein